MHQQPTVVPSNRMHPVIFIFVLFYSIPSRPCPSAAPRTRPRPRASRGPCPPSHWPRETRHARPPPGGAGAPAQAQCPLKRGAEAAPAGPAQGAFPRAAPAAAPSHAAGVPPSGARRGQAGESSPGEPRDPSPLWPALRPVRPGKACGEGGIPVTATRRALNDSARAGRDWLRSL